jgi:hypothetical protein
MLHSRHEHMPRSATLGYLRSGEHPTCSLVVRSAPACTAEPDPTMLRQGARYEEQQQRATACVAGCPNQAMRGPCTSDAHRRQALPWPSLTHGSCTPMRREGTRNTPHRCQGLLLCQQHPQAMETSWTPDTTPWMGWMARNSFLMSAPPPHTQRRSSASYHAGHRVQAHMIQAAHSVGTLICGSWRTQQA